MMVTSQMPASLTLFAETSVAKSRRAGRCSEAVSGIARKLWPSKTAVNLAGRSGVTQRAAERWLEGQNDMSAEALVELLRSDAGFHVLSGLMAGSSLRWWAAVQNARRLDEINRKHALITAELDALRILV